MPISDERGKPGGEAAAWAARAGELAAWAWSFVNRTDVWGSYHPLADRGRAYRKADGTPATLGHVTTRPRPAARGKVYLTPEVLARHFAAGAPEHVVGLHTTGPDNLSRWGAVEVDQHGDGGNSPEANLVAALAWHAELTRLGFRPLLTDSNGKGGYHLRVFFAAPAPTPLVFALLKRLTKNYARHGLTAAPETFPKQPRIEPGRFGNWLRLPGRHHTREHWSRAWEGSCWLAGADAAAFLLTFAGDPLSLIPADLTAPQPPPPPPAPVVVDLFRAKAVGGRRGPSLSRRVAGYMSRLPHLGEGQGRDDVAYHFACWLVRDMRLPDDTALEWLRQWDAGNAPPKGEEALRKVIAGAHAYGQSPYGCGLDREPPRKVRGHVVRILSFTATLEV